MAEPLHISGIRIAHVHAADRAVRVNRPTRIDGPLEWERVSRLGGIKVSEGRGQSGLRYRMREQTGDWRVTVVSGPRREIEIGRARMRDHALALANMWEEAVLSGRIDMS